MVSVIWHGHSNFQIFSDGLSIIIDPFFTGNPKAACGWEDIEKPDLLLLTHDHRDHIGDAVPLCKKFGCHLATTFDLVPGLTEQGVSDISGFNIGGSMSFQGITVTMTEATHATGGITPVGFIITLPNGFTIYHAGDTGIFASMQLWGELYPIDVAILPVGGYFTMDARQAALAAKLLKTKSVIPSHWGTFPILEQNTAAFTAELARTAPACRCITAEIGKKVQVDA